MRRNRKVALSSTPRAQKRRTGSVRTGEGNGAVAAAYGRSDGFCLPEGRFSFEEFNALRVLSGQEPIEGERPHRSGPGARKAELDLSSLRRESPSEETIRLCIDFGTAMSKAWATGTNVADTVPLVLGRYAGLGDTLPVPSSIYISGSGHVFLGADAEKQHRQEIDQGRERIWGILTSSHR